MNNDLPGVVVLGLEARDELKRVDAMLAACIAPLQYALRTSKPAVLMTCWNPTHAMAILPFELHLRWPDRVSELPLNGRFGLVPFHGGHERIVHLTRYPVGEAHLGRRAARNSRYRQGRDLRHDFRLPDWEDAVDRHPQRLWHLSLPGSCFVALDVIQEDGQIGYGHRSILGRFTPRNAVRPSVLVPGRRAKPADVASRLATATVLVAFADAGRGPRARSQLVSTLTGRGASRPTLVVCASPADLAAIDLPWLRDEAPVFVVGTPPLLPAIDIRLVNQERVQEEARYEIFMRELEGRSVEGDKLLRQLARAWWTAWGALTTDPARELGVARAMDAYDRFRSSFPWEAPEYRPALMSALDVLRDAERARERRDGFLEAIATLAPARSTGRAMVLFRTHQAAVDLLQDLGEDWRLAPPPWGISGVSIVRDNEEDALGSARIVTGVYGPHVIDTLLGLGAIDANCITDPVEARVAAATARAQVEMIRGREGLDGMEGVLSAVLSAFQTVAAAGAPDVRVDILTLPKPSRYPDIWNADTTPEPVEKDQYVIIFEDGTRVPASPHRRFDVILEGRQRRWKQVRTAELEPGDEVVLVEAESHAAFSERLLAILDGTVLRDDVVKRQEWQAMVTALVKTHWHKARDVQARLAARGITVARASIRGWIVRQPEDAEDKAVPLKWETFFAFSQAIGIRLPDEALREWYLASRRLRVTHQRAGRELVRAMCGAATGRLSLASLQRIERDWGLRTRDLLNGVRLTTVDTVIPPETMEDKVDD